MSSVPLQIQLRSALGCGLALVALAVAPACLLTATPEELLTGGAGAPDRALLADAGQVDAATLDRGAAVDRVNADHAPADLSGHDAAAADGALADRAAPSDRAAQDLLELDSTAGPDVEPGDAVGTERDASAMPDATGGDAQAADLQAPDTVGSDTTSPDLGHVDAAPSDRTGDDMALPDLAEVDAGPANTPPLAAFSVTPGAGVTGTAFHFDASASSDPEDGTGLSFEWAWNGNNNFNATGASKNHTFTMAGTYTVTLRVRDSGGLEAYATRLVVVVPAAELLTVTTAQDEDDIGAGPGAWGGAGCSLREAIAYANGQSGSQTVLVPSGLTIALASEMIDSTDSDGLNLVGYGAALDGAGLRASESCFKLNTANTRLIGLEIARCPNFGVFALAGASETLIAHCRVHHCGTGSGALYLVGDGSVVGPGNEVSDNEGSGVRINGINMIVSDNAIHGNGLAGVYVDSGAVDATLRGNFLGANAWGIRVESSVSNVAMLHNTVDGSGQVGVFVAANAVELRLVNNVISHSASWGLSALDANFSQLDGNDLFGNAGGACSGCASLGAMSLAVDPRFRDRAGRDYRLLADSLLIDAALDLGGDVNGPAPGRFNGEGPDIGAWEAPR